MFNKIDNHVEQAQARMVQRFKDKENINKLIAIDSQRIQDLEDVLFRMLNERAISNAVGVQLDGLGQNYGEIGLRNGRSDDLYRTALQGIPAKLRGAGQHEIIVQTYRSLTGANSVNHAYYYPRLVFLFAVVDEIGLITNAENITKEMESIRAQGIKIIYGESLGDGINFQLSSEENGNVQLGTGLQAASHLPGGTLATLLI